MISLLLQATNTVDVQMLLDQQQTIITVLGGIITTLTGAVGFLWRQQHSKDKAYIDDLKNTIKDQKSEIDTLKK